MATAIDFAQSLSPTFQSRQPAKPLRLGAYEVVTRIGAGASATVHLARAVNDPERLVALRVLHPHMTSDEGFVALFVDEARIAAGIDHPCVARVHDLSSHGRLIFTVVDYIEGDTLATLMRHAAARKNPSPLGVTLRIALDVLDGLSAAHALGEGSPLVHRDVSPKNIMVGTDGMAHITDFGVARAEGRVATTLPGVIKGKLGYMAPEALEGLALDPRADLYSLGVTLWEALTLERLFSNRRSFIEARHSSREPARDLRAVLSDAPEALAMILSKALSVDPDARYSSAIEMSEAIRTALTHRIAARSEVTAWLLTASATKIEREREALRRLGPRQTDRVSVMPSSLDLFAPKASLPLSESDSGIRLVERAALKASSQILTADPLFAPLPPTARQRTMPPPRSRTAPQHHGSNGTRELDPALATVAAPAEDYSFDLELSLPEARPSNGAIVRNHDWLSHTDTTALWANPSDRVHRTDAVTSPLEETPASLPPSSLSSPSSPPCALPPLDEAIDTTPSLPPLSSFPLTPPPEPGRWSLNASTVLALCASLAVLLAFTLRALG